MAATASSSSSDPVTAPLPSASSHPPKAPFVRPPHPPLYLGKPVNPPPQSHQGGAGPFYPSVGAGRGFPPRPVSDRMVTVANPAGYIRNSSSTAVMSLQAQAQARPFLFAAAAAGTGDPAAQMQQHSLPPAGTHQMRPPHPQHHQFVVPRQQPGHGGPPRTAPVATAAQPKVATFPTLSSAPENNLNAREDTVVVIHDRKVRLSEGNSGSLYALCRSWVRNGLPQESQPTIGDSLKILPKPLPASLVNSHMPKKSEEANEAKNSDKEEDLGSNEHLSAPDLLKGHIKHAKKVRAGLRKERLLRIERYKQRLSLLLPTQIELIGRNEATAGS